MRLAPLAFLAVCGLAGSLHGASPARIAEFPTPTTSSGPYGITLGPDGHLYFTENLANQIGRISTDGTITDELPIPTASSGPTGITVGPDGYLYYAENAVSKIGIVNAKTNPIGPEYATITASAHPMHVATGPDEAVYFSENSAAMIGRITPAGSVTEHAASSPGTAPWCVSPFPGGIMYDENTGDVAVAWYVGRDNSEVAPALTAGSQATGCAWANDGGFWLAESGTNKVWRADGNGVVEHSIPTASSGAGQMIAGRHGDVWFVETAVDKLGHAFSGGLVKEYALPSGSAPTDLAWGPDGNIWITANGKSEIIRFIPLVLGDVNDDGLVNVADVFYMINFLFAGGPAPVGP